MEGLRFRAGCVLVRLVSAGHEVLRAAFWSELHFGASWDFGGGCVLADAELWRELRLVRDGVR